MEVDLNTTTNESLTGSLFIFQPVSNIVRYNASIVRNSKVSILICLGLGLQEDWQFSQRSLKFLFKRLVSCEIPPQE